MPLELDFEERFTGPALDTSRWLPYYLPHWSSRRLAAARYEANRGLRLRIDPDQQPWCPEWDGDVRVSSLQTGTFSGPLGSRIGQHRFHPDAVVREEQENVLLHGLRYGRVEVRARACSDPSAMVALWLIGYEDESERSGELCVCEIFGSELDGGEAVVGMGIHPFGDPVLRDTFAKERFDLDATDPHVYAAEWEPGRTTFFVDGEAVKADDQAPDYPLQLMLGIYDFGPAGGAHPKEFAVDWLRGYSFAAQDFGGSERA